MKNYKKNIAHTSFLNHILEAPPTHEIGCGHRAWNVFILVDGKDKTLFFDTFIEALTHSKSINFEAYIFKCFCNMINNTLLNLDIKKVA